jgi:gluconate 2-dehydrogenase gamma chain
MKPCEAPCPATGHQPARGFFLPQSGIEGMLCDPMHGGNVGMVGWQMIGYPGPVMSYRDQIGKDEIIRRKPVSLTQVVGHPVKGLEEEK